MLLAIRAPYAPVGSLAVPNRQDTRSRNPVKDCEDSFSLQQPESLPLQLKASPNDTVKFGGSSVSLTKDLVESSVGNERALLGLAKEAAKKEESRQQMIRYLVELQNSSLIHKNRRTIYLASKHHLHSTEIEDNYRSSLRGLLSASDEHVNWSIAPC